MALSTAGGCTPFGPTLTARLQDEDPSVRARAAVEAGGATDRSTVPFLIDRLSDSESDVRLFASLALKKITGETMGFRHQDPRAPREEAIRRWRAWLQEQSPAPTTRTGGGER